MIALHLSSKISWVVQSDCWKIVITGVDLKLHLYKRIYKNSCQFLETTYFCQCSFNTDDLLTTQWVGRWWRQERVKKGKALQDVPNGTSSLDVNGKRMFERCMGRDGNESWSTVCVSRTIKAYINSLLIWARMASLTSWSLDSHVKGRSIPL